MADMDAVTQALGEAELAVIRRTGAEALAGLTEDELIDLHARVRRARNKYTGQYRRQAGARVAEAGARGAARPRNRRAADRAEVFEAALARVSAALARAARRSAAELRSDRLAAARAARGGPGPEVEADTGDPRPSGAAARPPVKSTGRQKRDASSVAAGARRQARRDSR
ncbi:MAG TPA: hypothetical protein VLM05_11465 [Mycobacteriales bacterium]|nr:hypothetical protein [Mycobacteriales bacterium]